MYSKNGNRPFVLIIFILCGLVVGGFIGQLLGGYTYLDWLNYGSEFGIDNPFSLDLGIVRLQFAIMIKFNISGIIMAILSIFLYKRAI